jgi:hypothetical protein
MTLSKPNGYILLSLGILLIAVVFVGVTFFGGSSSPRQIKPINYTWQDSNNRDKERCVCEWTDVNFRSHCGHTVRFLWRNMDSTGTPTSDVFHCLTDSVRVAFPIPRYVYAEAPIQSTK